MTDTDADPAAANEAEGASTRRIHPWQVIKGCGCASMCIVLAVTVALAGDGKLSSWGSGIIGVLILILVVGLSGTNGWWTQD